MHQLRKLNDLKGYSLNAIDGEIGELEEIYFDDEYWVVRYLIVSTGNWLQEDRVLIVPGVINGIFEEIRSIDVELTRDQIRHCPPVDTEMPVARHYEQEYHNHYGWEPYWSVDPMLGSSAYIPQPVDDVPAKVPEDPHLRSSNEVEGYRIHASNGNIGHVNDFIVEDKGWKISYLEIDTRNWLPGKHVLIAPSWVRQIVWAEHEVTVDLSREIIQTAPAYDPSELISHEYEVALHKHYEIKEKN